VLLCTYLKLGGKMHIESIVIGICLSVYRFLGKFILVLTAFQIT
jgi:hypothetical protein